MRIFERIQQSWKDSGTIASVIFTFIASVMGVAGLSLNGLNNWLVRFMVIFSFFIILIIVVRLIIWQGTKNGITIKVRNITVKIRQGDIFNADGWRLIPFNEYFDTRVDDVIVNHNSLNGIFIDEHIEDLSVFRQVLTMDDASPLVVSKEAMPDGRWKYPIGCIKTYHEYMLLAFAHINPQYEAHLSWSEYEQCLRQMWQEISRTYANKPIYLPLLGGGVTRFDDKAERADSDLLKCMICTLRTHNAQISQPITILLTKETMQKINIYDLKGVK